MSWEWPSRSSALSSRRSSWSRSSFFSILSILSPKNASESALPVCWESSAIVFNAALASSICAGPPASNACPNVQIRRILTHLSTTPWRVRRAFPTATLTAIESAVRNSESQHRGELRFAIEGALDPRALIAGQTPRERALEVFSLLRVWDTEHNTGVLIYLLLADRDVEIVADRGIHALVGEAEWARICHAMEVEFAAGRFEQGALQGIGAVSRLLGQHFPERDTEPPNDLPDSPVIL